MGYGSLDDRTKTAEKLAEERKASRGFVSVDRSHIDHSYLRTANDYSHLTKEHQVAAAKTPKRVPMVLNPNKPYQDTAYKTFAEKIRHITDNGWILINAVLEIFQVSMEEGQWDRALNAATWLADRGFGKPVQVTALTDAEGNPFSFTLWQPASGLSPESNGDYQPPPKPPDHAEIVVDLAPPPPVAERAADTYALGPARIWGVGEPEKRPGE